jgi:hypothetical protein
VTNSNCLDENIDIEVHNTIPVVSEFVPINGEHRGVDSSAGFTDIGHQLLSRTSEGLAVAPTFWPLLGVQLGNLWNAQSVDFSFPNDAIRVELTGLEDKSQLLEETVGLLHSGHRAPSTETSLLCTLIASALVQTEGAVVLAASGRAGEPVNALKLGLDVTERGSTNLEPGRVVLHITPKAPAIYLKEFGEAMVLGLNRRTCSDRTRVRCGQELSSFVPISLPAPEEAEPLSLGIWAFPAERDAVSAIRLGKTFSKLDSEGMRRQELTFGVFRTGLVGSKEAADKSQARHVVTFTHHLVKTSSRVVWLWNGVEVAYQNLLLPQQFLAVTSYLEAPPDCVWDTARTHFRWQDSMSDTLEGATKDLHQALELMVREYNNYSPGFDLSTLGCWTLLAISAVALGGALAPFMGSQLALLFGCIIGLLLIRAEFRHRHKERFSIGHGLKLLAESLEQKPTEPLWDTSLQLWDSKPYPEKSDWLVF